MATLRRQKRDRDFSILPSAAIGDGVLSWKARGILLYILAKPNNWKTRTEDIIAAAPDGRDSVRAGLRELRAAGYMKYIRFKDADGRFVSEYIVSETPTLADDLRSRDGKTENGKPVPGESSPGDGKPVPLLSINSIIRESYNDSIVDTIKSDDEVEGVVVEVEGNILDISKILKGENDDKTAAALVALAGAVPAKRWNLLAERYPNAAHFAETVAKMPPYYRRKPKELKRIKDFYRLLNNWLKKEWVDNSVAPFRDAYVGHILRRSGVAYQFNNFDTGPDIKGINGLIKQIAAARATLGEKIGISTAATPIAAYTAFLENLPDFWASHRPATLSKNFASIVGRMSAPSKTTKPTGGGYAEFSEDDVANIVF